MCKKNQKKYVYDCQLSFVCLPRVFSAPPGAFSTVGVTNEQINSQTIISCNRCVTMENIPEILFTCNRCA